MPDMHNPQHLPAYFYWKCLLISAFCLLISVLYLFIFYRFSHLIDLISSVFSCTALDKHQAIKQCNKGVAAYITLAGRPK